MNSKLEIIVEYSILIIDFYGTYYHFDSCINK